MKNFKYVKIPSVNPLYLIINKINRYIEESTGNRNAMLIPTDESREVVVGSSPVAVT